MITDVYCKEAVVPFDAFSLQGHVSNLLQNFDQDSPGVNNSIQYIQDFFFRQMGVPEHQHNSKIFGIVTTAHAFRLPSSWVISPSPNDTRIAMMIGKPVDWVEKGGKWHPLIEEKYVVAARIVDKKRVYLSKVYPSPSTRVFQPAIVLDMIPTIAEEASLISSTDCCESVVSAGKEILRDASHFCFETVKNEISQLYDSLQQVIQPDKSGSFSLARKVHVKRKAFDSSVVEETAKACKRYLGEHPKPFKIHKMK